MLETFASVQRGEVSQSTEDRRNADMDLVQSACFSYKQILHLLYLSRRSVKILYESIGKDNTEQETTCGTTAKALLTCKDPGLEPSSLYQEMKRRAGLAIPV